MHINNDSYLETKIIHLFKYCYRPSSLWIPFLRPCLLPKKICKIFQIPRHIKSLDACMKY